MRTKTRTLAALLAAALALAGAHADGPTAYRKIARFHVAYQDLLLGEVTGDAFCKWSPGDDNNNGFAGNSSEHRAHCRVRLFDPALSRYIELAAGGDDIREPSAATDRLTITLHGHSPSQAARTPNLGQSVAARAGAVAQVALGPADAQKVATVPVMARAVADDATVTLELGPDCSGALVGTWSYLADPITERDLRGVGRAGALIPLKDEVPAPRPGGFKALERGDESWSPVLPQIYITHVLEDQAGFDKGEPKYSLSRVKDSANLTRTLVIFGSDLPVYENEDFAGIRSKAPDGLAYRVVADSRAHDLSDDNRKKIARALRDEAASMPAFAGKLATLDAVIVTVEQRALNVPGPKEFDWNGVTGDWTLQYGDNTALPRFTRIVRVQDHPEAPGINARELRDQRRRWNTDDLRQRERQTRSEAENALGIEHFDPVDESEVVGDLALPDQVVVEVVTGGPITLDTLPVVVGGEALGGATVPLVAKRVPHYPTLYRTGPVIFIGALAPGAKSAAIPAGASTVIPVIEGKRVLAKIDESQTHFLRSGLGVAVARPPGTLWLDALNRAGACQGRMADPTNWYKLASDTAQTISIKGYKIDIKYGDHAAMLILRDALVASMTRIAKELDLVAAEPVTSSPRDHLIDAWYRNAHEIVIGAPDSPLATFAVDSPAGKVAFKEAYARDFEQKNFQTETSADGAARFREWRRQASHAALDFYRGKLAEAIAEDQGIDACDREKLLKLGAAVVRQAPRATREGDPVDAANTDNAGPTGRRQKGLITTIAPLLMKVRGPGQISEPDFVARSYVDTLDELAAQLKTTEEYSHQLNSFALSLVSAATGGLAGGFALGTVAVVSIFDTVTVTLTISVMGLANIAYNSGTELYKTYQEHEDVAFAFAHYKALGVEQYFDARSKATPWWNTGAKVFGDVLFNSANPGGGASFEEGPMLNRGAGIAKRFARGEIESVAGLSVEDRAAYALFTMRQEEILASRGVMTRAMKAAHGALERLAGVPGSVAARELPAAEREAEAAALAEVEDLGKAPKPTTPDRELRTAQTSVISHAEAAEYELRTSPTSRIAAESADFPKTDGVPFPRDKGEHLTVGRYSFAVKGKEAINVEIVAHKGSGQFAHVYVLKAPPENLPVPLKKSLVGRRLVIKTLKSPSEIREFKIAPSNEETGETEEKILDAIREDTAQRLAHAEKILDATGQGAIPHAEFQVFEEQGFMIQELLEVEEGKLEFLPKIVGGRFEKPLAAGQKTAVVKLVRRLIDAGVEAHDINPENIYLQLEREGWVAKILDPDFMNRFGEKRLPGGEEYHEYWVFEGFSSLRTPAKTPLEAQMAILERKGWIKFNPIKGVDEPGLLAPEDFKGVIDWPAFHPRSPGTPNRSPPPSP